MNFGKLRGGRAAENLGGEMVGTSGGETVENFRDSSRNTYYVCLSLCATTREMILANHQNITSLSFCATDVSLRATTRDSFGFWVQFDLYSGRFFLKKNTPDAHATRC